MTREELKEHCIKQIEQCEMWAIHRGEEPSGKVYEEHKAILDILEQEPCEDAISRVAVIKSAYDISEIDGEHFDKPCMVVDVEDIQKLSPVTPSRRKGHWLRVTTVNPKEFCNRCSECGYEQFYAERYKFCPNCGADMESEDMKGDTDEAY